MLNKERVTSALRASGFHLLASIFISSLCALIIFFLWYPHPYYLMSGGVGLFLILMTVDVVCGPMLTMIVYNPKKTIFERCLDISLIAILQFSALCYGIFTMWTARPIFLVHEIDRFKVITRNDVNANELTNLPENLRPKIWKGPLTVGIREPQNTEERSRVLFESLQGGRDFGERPEFYIKYDGKTSKNAQNRAKKLESFIIKYNIKSQEIAELGDIEKLYYIPVIARQDWVAVIDEDGKIKGFLKGEGF
jgi:hypothetical protein